MNKKYCKLNNLIDKIISAIDLNYLIAEAKLNQYHIKLVCGLWNNDIQWTDTYQILPHDFAISKKIINDFVYKNFNNVIKINVYSNDYDCPLDRNIVIHVPKEIDFNAVKNIYSVIPV